jgi:hypothetical protein
MIAQLLYLVAFFIVNTKYGLSSRVGFVLQKNLILRGEHTIGESENGDLNDLQNRIRPDRRVRIPYSPHLFPSQSEVYLLYLLICFQRQKEHMV